MNIPRHEPAGVRFENVELYFGSNHVLRDITLAIEPGEFFAFLGPSGCGKTTLLRLVAGFGEARSGRVLIGDQDVTGLPPWERNVGMVFQSYALWPHMSVRRNVAFGLEERRLARAEVHRRTDAALELVGLLDLAERRPAQLSGGQQQRVALARTLVVEPRVLLLDEPLSNLDAKLRVQMRQELLALQRKLSLTTIFVTHDQEEANTTADRIAVIDAGTVQQIGTPADLYDDPATPFVADFLGTANVLDGKLAETPEGRVFQTPDGFTVALREAQLAERSFPAGGACSILFRPQNLEITTTPGPTPAGRVALSGRLSHREFLGSLVRYSVNVKGATILVDETHQRGHTPIEIGVEVRLQLPIEQIVVLASRGSVANHARIPQSG